MVILDLNQSFVGASDLNSDWKLLPLLPLQLELPFQNNQSFLLLLLHLPLDRVEVGRFDLQSGV